MDLSFDMVSSAKPLVSTVVPSLDGLGLLPACLDSLTAPTYRNIEVIVVDNRSSDGSGLYVQQKYLWVRVTITETNLGYSGGCNLGAASSAGKNVLFLSNHTMVTPTFLESRVSNMQSDRRLGVAQSLMMSSESPDVTDSAGSFFTMTGILLHMKGKLNGRHPSSPTDIFSAQGACMLIRRSLFERLEGFDEDFVVYFEDTDLCWRAWLLGYKVRLIPFSLIFHSSGRTTSKSGHGYIAYHTFKNRLCSLIKNLSLKDLLIVLPMHLAICLGGSLAFFANGKPASSAAILRAMGWNIFNLRRTLKKRRIMTSLATVERGRLFPKLARPMPLRYLLAESIGYVRNW